MLPDLATVLKLSRIYFLNLHTIWQAMNFDPKVNLLLVEFLLKIFLNHSFTITKSISSRKILSLASAGDIHGYEGLLGNLKKVFIKYMLFPVQNSAIRLLHSILEISHLF